MKDKSKAFPLRYEEFDNEGRSFENHDFGMDLRDWFAGQALNGVLNNTSLLKQLTVAADRFGKPEKYLSAIANLSYEYADAMMEARKGGDDE